MRGEVFNVGKQATTLLGRRTSEGQSGRQVGQPNKSRESTERVHEARLTR